VTAFKFGQNWKDYALNTMDEGKLKQAKAALADLIDRDDLHGLTFLDIGCGSGLHSASAALLGAETVYATDIDPDCIAVTSNTIRRFLPEANGIHIRQASILDPAAGLPQANVVYSWGVLHHTGSMYRAIEAAAKLVRPGGLFVIAIYNRHPTSRAWHFIKWLYNRVPRFVQRLMYYFFYGVIYVAKLAATGQNPLKKERGMDFGYDVVDWVGGYPYEYASIDDITQFVTPLGFAVEKVVPAQVGTGCNEFVFRKSE
jgi:2-polyprenyl-6-hydroxyphenyl methylase/3-demethylubiquinone-9 3-methyltransferase